jgi:hypothetical protein
MGESLKGILYQSARIRQPLDENFTVICEKFRFPAVAGEQQDLPLLACFL